ncbi:MAG: adenylyl-sulfate kinase [Hydrogenophilales bacterium 28-61-23]|nr:MAG: adenylyl-sulfate kinase [Hydrogenophilales bacterium 28-61-23]
MDSLITAYGGELKSLMASPERIEAIKREALTLASLDLSWKQICELELLLNGALSPLSGYMNQAEMRAVLADMKLPDGLFWPRPVMLSVSEKAAQKLAAGQTVALRDSEGVMPAILHITEVWPADSAAELALAETSGVPLARAQAEAGEYYVAGRLEGVTLPPRHDFLNLRLTPAEMREQFARLGWRRVMAYQAGQALHRPQYEFLLRTAIQMESNLLIHAVAGSDPVLESGHFALVRACQALMPRMPASSSMLALNPMTPWAAGPRKTLLKAIMARNYGCSQLVIGGETPLEGRQRRGQDTPNLAKDSVYALARESMGVTLLPFPRMVYVEDRDEWLAEAEIPAGARAESMSGTELTRRLMQNLKVPDWFSFPEVLDELRKAYPPRSRQGFTVFFTGLSGSGKSTIARALTVRLMEMGGRRVSLLDGDIVRTHLSSELGFSKAHRDINIRRIGFVASEISKHGGIAICAPIAPYQATRRAVRAMIEEWGGFIEIHVSTSIETCEQRDRKGLYAKARAGLIPEFTGVSDPYEVPEQPELAIDTDRYSVDEAVQMIVLKLEHEGYLR